MVKMKIQAYKSNSGVLFETAEKCEAEDLKDELLKFLAIEYPVPYYDYDYASRYLRELHVREIAEKIIENKEAFIKLISL